MIPYITTILTGLGTGKTVSLLAIITSFQFAHPDAGKLIYCTRTVPEMTKCVEELKLVIQNRDRILGEDRVKDKFLGLCLSSRRNMCIQPQVRSAADTGRIDVLCRQRIAPWVRDQNNRGHIKFKKDATLKGEEEDKKKKIKLETSPPKVDTNQLCEFYENYLEYGSDADIPDGIYTLDNMRELGHMKTWCPYFAARHMIKYANVVVYNFQYLIDPKVASMVSKELGQDSIVVFDEAHNLDSVCIEALSLNFNVRSLDAARYVRVLW